MHARGAGAHGTFTLHTSLEDFTCAKVLTQVGNITPTFTRFSTVLGSSGAAETAREGEFSARARRRKRRNDLEALMAYDRSTPTVRGFSTKFYTSQGNWDIVGVSFVCSCCILCEGIRRADRLPLVPPPPLHSESQNNIPVFFSESS